MNATAVRHALESITNVALLIVSVAIVILVVGTSSRSSRSVSPVLHAGDQFPIAISGSGSNRETLVLALSARCSFCEASIPFYQRLAASKLDPNVRIVALFPERDEEVRGFVKRIGFDMTVMVALSFRDLRIEGTPTLILLDSQRKIEKVWTGKLSPHQEQEVLNRVHHSGA